jgi:O-antigen ligase/polysaccharide polymerase Wzy-like membrane protein
MKRGMQRLPDATATMPRLRARSISWNHGFLVATAAFAVVFGLGSVHGGYFPTSWGWAALSLAWAAGVALVVRAQIHYSRLELAMCAALAALVLWVGLSAVWSQSVSRSVLDAERALVYLAGLVALFAVARSATLRHLLGGTLAAIAALSTYAVATRLFPERLGSFDPVSTYRLGAPLGYWNALGILTVIGILLALGSANAGKRLITRALAGAALVPLATALFFTYSRGAWIALILGLGAEIAFEKRRLQLMTTILLVGVPPALAVWLSSRSSALTHMKSSLAEASTQGHRLAAWVLGLAVLAGLIAFVVGGAARSVRVSAGLRRAYAIVLVAALVLGLAVIFERYGDPVTMTRTAYSDFTGSTNPRKGTDLNTRLFSLWGNGRPDMWKLAWRDAEEHPWVGSGAGTYELFWARHRPLSVKVVDAHSLFAQTLAEVGPLGLALLIVAFAIPLTAARRARAHPLGAAAFGAYVAYLFHTGVDWDWQMPVVTLVGLFCGGALLLAVRRAKARSLTTPVRVAGLAVVIVVSAFALIGAMGNNALAKGAAARDDQRWRDSEAQAKKAMRWARWSSDPWQMAGEAQLAQKHRAQARRSFRTAISKDPHDWELWVDLALASPQPARRRAALTALRLNPLSPEIAASHPLLGLGP